MKKAALLSLCFAILLSCKKGHDAIRQHENSSQVLTKVIKTLHGGNQSLYNEEIAYEYNDLGNIIQEGNIALHHYKAYLRDGKQRIIQILSLGTTSNRDNIHVYYSSPQSDKVANS